MQVPTQSCECKLTTTQGWSDCVSFGNFSAYKDRFERVQSYFEPRFKEATELGNSMIKTILAHTKQE